jgi:hypothetical protein
VVLSADTTAQRPFEASEAVGDKRRSQWVSSLDGLEDLLALSISELDAPGAIVGDVVGTPDRGSVL